MATSSNTWQQIENVTAKRIIRALKQDGWNQEQRRRATIGFTKMRKDLSGNDRIVVHYHPKKTYGPITAKEIALGYRMG